MASIRGAQAVLGNNATAYGVILPPNVSIVYITTCVLSSGPLAPFAANALPLIGLVYADDANGTNRVMIHALLLANNGGQSIALSFGVPFPVPAGKFVLLLSYSISPGWIYGTLTGYTE